MSETGQNSLIDVNDEGDFIDPEVALQQILDDPELVQHITRTEHENRETIAGYFRVEFEPGQRRLVLHVPFAPPLKIVPHVEVRATDQQDVRFRITDRQKFGARVEVILSKPTESNQRILVEIIADESD